MAYHSNINYLVPVLEVSPTPTKIPGYGPVLCCQECSWTSFAGVGTNFFQHRPVGPAADKIQRPESNLTGLTIFPFLYYIHLTVLIQ